MTTPYQSGLTGPKGDRDPETGEYVQPGSDRFMQLKYGFTEPRPLKPAYGEGGITDPRQYAQALKKYEQDHAIWLLKLDEHRYMTGTQGTASAPSFKRTLPLDPSKLAQINAERAAAGLPPVGERGQREYQPAFLAGQGSQSVPVSKPIEKQRTDTEILEGGMRE